MITREAILSELNLEYEKLRAITSCWQQADSGKKLAFIDALKKEIEAAVSLHGDSPNPREMKLLCEKITEAQTKLKNGSGELDKLSISIEKTRKQVRKKLAVAAGWEKEPLFVANQPSATCLEGLNKAREHMGFAQKIKVEEGIYLTPEEIRMFAYIAHELGDYAMAEFAAGLMPEKFAFNNRTIQNLRPWIGDFEANKGNRSEDIPSPLLTLQKFKHLKELLFNKWRDRFYLTYKESGSEGVEKEMEDKKSKITDPETKKFYDEAIQYFKDLDKIQRTGRLRSSLDGNTKFPAPHQLMSIQEIARKKQILIADEMGGGKTGSAIAGFENLRNLGRAKKCLVICPSNIVSEWQKRLGSNGQGYFKIGSEPKVTIIRSTDPKREKTWEDARESDYIVMSIDMLRMQTGDKSHVDYAREIGADYFVIDEAHNIKNPSGSDTENVYQTSRCDSIRNGYTVLLSGTPIPNTIIDIAAQIRLLHANQDRPAIEDPHEQPPDEIDFTNLRSLSKTISKNHTRLVRNLLLLRMLKRPTEDCLPVGTNIDIEQHRSTEMDPLEQAAYDAIFEDPFYLATEKIQLMRRICLHDNKNNPSITVTGTGTSKYKQLTESIDEFLEEFKSEPDKHSDKIIIAANGYTKGITSDFDDNKDPATSNLESYIAGKLRMDYEKKGVAIFILDGKNTGTNLIRDEKHKTIEDYDGAMMTQTKQIIANFRNHQGPAILVTNIKVAGEGIDLSFASRGILLAPTYTISERDQMARRLYRRGQKHNVRFRTLQTTNTIEQGMAEYAIRKQKIINDLLHGKPLTDFEQELINEDIKTVNKGGFMAYETMSPAKKVMWFLNRIKNLTKEQIRDFMEMDDGKYAREFAELYHRDWETTYSGNNARMVSAITEKLLEPLKKKSRQNIQIADVACGGLVMARMFENDDSVTVWSNDISREMLAIGAKLLNGKIPPERISENTMDKLPYKDESMDIAVNSLALQYARHNSRRPSGDERIQALCELNRVLKPGGKAIISLPPNTIEDREKFDRLAELLKNSFGFELCKELSGHWVSTDREDEKSCDGYVFTLKKTGIPCPDKTDENLWKTLFLSFEASKTIQAKPLRDEKPPPSGPGEAKDAPPGSFHEKFLLGDNSLSYSSENAQKAEKEKFDHSKAQYKQILKAIDELISAHGSIKDIPEEKLLSVPLLEVATHEKQKIRDAYFKTLINKYKGKIERIPVEEISAQSPVILVRGYTKKKGHFLCLAKMDKDSGKLGTYGKRYFYESEFTGQTRS